MGEYELKPCPKCGGKAEIRRVGEYRNLFAVMCSQCGWHAAKMSEGALALSDAVQLWESRVEAIENVSKIKPCPFCGALLEKKHREYWGTNSSKKKELVSYDYWEHPLNGCIIDFASPEGFYVYEDTIDDWNRRVSDVQ